MWRESQKRRSEANPPRRPYRREAVLARVPVSWAGGGVVAGPHELNAKVVEPGFAEPGEGECDDQLLRAGGGAK